MRYTYDGEIPPCWPIVQKFHEIPFLEKYGIAPTQSEFHKDKKYIGYRTSSAYYILSPWTCEKSPSCRISIAYGVKCFASGHRISLKQLKNILERGWIPSWNKRRLSVDKFNKMYNQHISGVEHGISDSDVPF